jgi:4-hydroxythreonine-4-phosphate dehydrogenase
MALRIGITTGDPAGIGPEVAMKAIREIDNQDIIPVLIGRSAIYQAAYPADFSTYQIINDAYNPDTLKSGERYFFDVPLDVPVPLPGHGNIETGRESRMYVDCAIDLWKRRSIDAITTGPVSKSLIEKSGTPFSGHTEYIAERIGEKNPLMMMFSEKYRVLLVTTHIPVSGIAVAVNEEKIMHVIRTGNESIRSIDGKKPRLAIAGLDPHCGDDGAIGFFDRDVTSRAAERARREGIDIDGPCAADTLFIPCRWEGYDLVIAQYHDQGLIPFKMLAFDSGVNVTLGLSITRTSVDHGTAFDIAGKGLAAHQSMLQAINLACVLEKNTRR